MGQLRCAANVHIVCTLLLLLGFHDYSRENALAHDPVKPAQGLEQQRSQPAQRAHDVYTLTCSNGSQVWLWQSKQWFRQQTSPESECPFECS